MMTKLFSIAIISLLLFSACNHDDSTPEGVYQLGESFVLAIQQTADCDCSGPSLTFAELLEDSRCPLEAICIWEGRAVVRIDVNQNEETQSIELISRAGYEELARDTIDQLVITLLDVMPYPVVNQQVEVADYSIELRVDPL